MDGVKAPPIYNRCLEPDLAARIIQVGEQHGAPCLAAAQQVTQSPTNTAACCKLRLSRHAPQTRRAISPGPRLKPLGFCHRLISVAELAGLTVMAYCTSRILVAATDEHSDRMPTYGEPVPEAVQDLFKEATQLGVQKVRRTTLEILYRLCRPLLVHGSGGVQPWTCLLARLSSSWQPASRADQSSRMRPETLSAALLP